ncbi:Carbon monoxide dehydrogenase large chain [Pseudonocardia sp. Ae168_Ps1]|uniref:xanthine dehydrogenase family protein molybdopterin-binding subunit n=1 Tax=unclassified Pseudonocardia TaxID=2619320 RepID=UPI00094ABF72|nr:MULTISPECIES: xanthine dehydrogenase family protein molybdopterin-binding subunit [unclassified Pseudonocardia]OLL76070.1 Carbon monoxide dehydrogenase large chain [Pseudonocardia sp. Ae150A_Ps1]OLL82069.1 Carbon monoxide dehydrogenase large chain [Pseudonocardia sp. Ae168_Ps1]OLL90143.1 Carbon monoxide dehydrogenase large chain [Pseudonocardia sp. Ae356_Ps1]
MREPGFRTDGTWVGADVPRREDPRLLAGRGRFVDDITLPRMLHAAFVRSTEAHALLTLVDLSEVRGVPGVVAAFDAAGLGLADVTALLDRPAEEFTPTSMPVLARDKVRYVGEPVAVVLATDPYAAEDGVEAAVVDYEPLDPVVTETAALAAAGAPVHDEAPGNVLGDVSLFATEGIDDVFATAAASSNGAVVSVEARTGRQNALPLETRGVVADWDDRDEQLLVRTCTQVPHQVRTVLARCAGLDEKQVRVTVPDMGGGFGQKCVVGREEIAAAAAARRLRRPVKWIEDRREALTASFLAREQHYTARAAFDADGAILALEADVVCDMGAYSCYPFTAGIEPLMASAEMPGVYRVPAYRVRGRAVTTNKAPTAPYRGVSRPQYVMVMERLMERAARSLGLDALDVRRRNLITEFPYRGINNITYDPGSYLESLDLCERVLRDEGWHRHTEPGRVVGIGYSCFSERTGYGSGAFAQRKMQVVPGFDLSQITMDLDGTVSVTTGTLSHGQSHETTFAQIVADRLGVPYDKVKIVQGDTDRITYGWGSFASRSVTIGGSAASAAAVKLGDQLRALAAHLAGVDVDTCELDGRGGVRAGDRTLPFTELAEVAYLRSHVLPKDVGPGLTATASFDVGGDGTFSNATHGCVVALDPGTGGVEILRYVCVEDCGVAIHPRVVDGQARGGIAQGIAGALFEEVLYDEAGQPLAPSFMEYKVPTAAEIPDVRIEHLETPCAFTANGAKGAGEGGTIGAPAAVLNAVNDALRGTGVELDSTPIPRHAIFAALAPHEEAS